MTKFLEILKSWVGAVVAIIVTIVIGTATTVIIYKDLENAIDDIAEDVTSLQDKEAAEARQWAVIREHETRITSVESKTEPITQDSWEKWGRVQGDVDRHNIYIDQHRREHQQMWFNERTR
jgi:cell division protein FtsN